MPKYNIITPELAEQMKNIVGADRFFAGAEISDDYTHDEMPIYGKHAPEVVCEVETTEEVAALMKLCNENCIPVTPRGAGTGLVGGAVPLAGGLVICTKRMMLVPIPTRRCVLPVAELEFVKGLVIFISSLWGIVERGSIFWIRFILESPECD